MQHVHVGTKYLDRILLASGISRSQIQLDPFSQKEFAKADRWFSQYSVSGSSGADGFIQPWVNEDGGKAFCFVNGPYPMMEK